MPPGAVKQRSFVPQEQWHVLLGAYRRKPGNHTEAARVAGVDRKTARRLFNDGNPRHPWSVRPIRDVLLGEAQAATARAAAAQAMAEAPATPDAVRAAREEAVATLADEARILKFARGNVQALLHMTTVLSATAMKLSRRVEATLESESFLKDMTLAQALLTLSRIAGIVQKGIYAAESVTGLERDVLGPPGERAGAPGTLGAPAITQDEALEELSRAVDLAKMLESRGLRVLQGGRGKDGPLIQREADADEGAKGEVINGANTPVRGPRYTEGAGEVDTGGGAGDAGGEGEDE